MLYDGSDALDRSPNVLIRVTRSRGNPQDLLTVSRNPSDVDLVIPSDWIEFFQLQAKEFLRSVAISWPDIKALQLISNLRSELASKKDSPYPRKDLTLVDGVTKKSRPLLTRMSLHLAVLGSSVADKSLRLGPDFLCQVALLFVTRVTRVALCVLQLFEGLTSVFGRGMALWLSIRARASTWSAP